MKTFEERYTAWIDGQLTGEELAAFEKELEAQQPDATADRAEAKKLGALLRTHSTAPALSNPDFFNLQLRQRIEAETLQPRRKPSPDRGGFFWSIPRLLLASAASLAVAGALYVAFVPGKTASPAESSHYFAQVVEAWPADSSISATTIYTPQDNLTVLWLDGLDYLPGDLLASQ